ncbi:adenine phosphoribosyltransferase [Glycomyces buryatensis]|uniref:Adenine phosphoribosyltransferase n=1 Tax=Glycomyces buryatensis TaxID=2570927 RepID=A0A4S8PQW8_9ACTN|nr:adenine phosphoribosyltransferase [Glycomyces buryatensis]THV33537.1 adenine phosphoribosyltransferase [Glycomyces buryatensis]
MDLTEFVPVVPDFPEPGVGFRDITPLLASPEAFRTSIDALESACDAHPYDSIAAFDARGFLWAAPLADRTAKPLIPIRKAGKLPRRAAVENYRGEYAEVRVEMHADAVAPGDRVLLVDDVIATGESMAAGIRLVEGLGGTVAACAALLEIGVLSGRDRLDGYPVISLLGKL